MIEAEQAGRIGFCQSFRQDDGAAVERVQSRMHGLGARHLRVPVAAAECAAPGGAAWFVQTVLELASTLDVMPSLNLGEAQDVPPWLTPLLAGLRGAVEHVEILGNGEAVMRAASLVREAGLLAVLGTSAPAMLARLRQPDARAFLGGFDVLGLHNMPGPGGGRAAWDLLLAELDRAAQACRPGMAVWITATGYAAWRHDFGAQAEAFIDAVATPAGRVYWRCLSDDPGVADPADSHLGIDDAAGTPRLLGRLLEGGVAEVERVLGTARQMAMPAVTGASRPVLVTGGSGFIGANLADRLADEGHRVLIYDALARAGVERNLRWLARRHPGRVSFALGDLRDEAALSEAASAAQAVFHLAGQVAVTTSMVQPLADFEVNARGTLALLEALRRRNPEAPLVFASTNKVYGDLADIALLREGESYLPADPALRTRGVDEQRPLCFHTPYGCSKGTADQYVLDYAHSFGLRTAVLRMSCIYGERQLGTEDQGWVAHFLLRAIADHDLTIYGDGRQVRDVLHVSDAVAAYMAAWARIGTVAGRAYNLGGGPANAISLLQLVGHIEDLLGRRVEVAFSDWRPGDQRYFVADTGAARRDLGLKPALGWREGVARLAEHFGAVPATTEAAQ